MNKIYNLIATPHGEERRMLTGCGMVIRAENDGTLIIHFESLCSRLGELCLMEIRDNHEMHIGAIEEQANYEERCTIAVYVRKIVSIILDTKE